MYTVNKELPSFSEVTKNKAHTATQKNFLTQNRKPMCLEQL